MGITPPHNWWELLGIIIIIIIDNGDNDLVGGFNPFEKY